MDVSVMQEVNLSVFIEKLVCPCSQERLENPSLELIISSSLYDQHYIFLARQRSKSINGWL